MTEPLYQAVRYLFPVLFLMAALRAFFRDRPEEVRLSLGGRFWATGLIVGVGLAVMYELFGARAVVEGPVMIGSGVFLVLALVARSGPWSARGFQAAGLLLVAQRSSAFAVYTYEKSVGRLDVLNSDFLLFAVGWLAGILLCATAFIAVSRIASRAGAFMRGAAAISSVGILVSEHFIWGYYSMVLNGWASVPEILFKPLVALVNHIDTFGYVQMAFAFALSTAGYAGRRRGMESVGAAPFRMPNPIAVPGAERSGAGLNPALRRKALWEARQEWHFGRAAILAVGLMAVVSFYFDSYSSRPLRLSHAEQVEASQGEIVIAVDTLKKEELRRYVYEDGTGRAIRFIVLRDEVGTIRAGYDACLMCGARGYVKSGKYLICLACGSAIYGPTVGRHGGCNPIPLAHHVEGGRLIIHEQDLVQGEGARFFASSEVG